jgi:hypothetical protein
MYEGTARGDTLLECNIKQYMYDFLAEHGAASTLGGWIRTAAEYQHSPSIKTMYFILVHRYLREEFPPDILDDMANACVDFDPNFAIPLGFFLAGTGILPESVELYVELQDLPADAQAALIEQDVFSRVADY